MTVGGADDVSIAVLLAHLKDDPTDSVADSTDEQPPSAQLVSALDDFVVPVA